MSADPAAVNPGQADINIAVGPDANLSPQVRQALEDLAQAVEQGQSPAAAPALTCDEVHSKPCAFFWTCQGVTF